MLATLRRYLRNVSQPLRCHFATCAVVGSAGGLRGGKAGSTIDAHVVAALRSLAGGIPSARLDSGGFTAECVDVVPPGIARVETRMHVLAMERLGDNLTQLMRRKGRLGLKSVLMLGPQLIALLEQLHEMGWVGAWLRVVLFLIA